MSSTSSLVYIQQCFTRYGMTTYTVLGNIGLLINIAIFSQTGHRRNSGSLYILSTSLCAFVGLNIAVIPVIYALDHPDPLTTSYLCCKLQFYFRHSFNQMMRTFFVLACADRYAISSKHVRIRSFSQYYVAIRVIPSIILFWLLLSIFPTMLHSLDNGTCQAKAGPYAIMSSTYILIVTGIFPLVFMMIFNILIMMNLRKVRILVVPMRNINQPLNQILRKRDRDMLTMLLIEVIGYTGTSIPLVVTLIYRSNTQNIIKSRNRQNIELFIYYFTITFLFYVNNTLSFWIYICASYSFRLEFKNLIMKCYASITRRQVRMNGIS